MDDGYFVGCIGKEWVAEHPPKSALLVIVRGMERGIDKSNLKLTSGPIQQPKVTGKKTASAVEQ